MRAPAALREHHCLLPQAGRVLRIDGDGLAYYYGTISDRHDAKRMLTQRIDQSRRMVGAERVELLLTDRASHKGYRYALATVKAYQGQRHGHRPANWEFLRDLMEQGVPGSVSSVFKDCEADDGFAMYTKAGRDVILTQDKDMRMVPGFHLDWETGRIVEVKDTDWGFVWNDKVWGRLWFWLQMLQGDTADNIPGLPFIRKLNSKGKMADKRIGETGAWDLIGNAGSILGPARVYEAYRSYYGDGAGVHMIEQASLLWIRRSNSWLDMFLPGGPLAGWESTDARYSVEQRINEAKTYAEAQGQ